MDTLHYEIPHVSNCDSVIRKRENGVERGTCSRLKAEPKRHPRTIKWAAPYRLLSYRTPFDTERRASPKHKMKYTFSPVGEAGERSSPTEKRYERTEARQDTRTGHYERAMDPDEQLAGSSRPNRTRRMTCRVTDNVAVGNFTWYGGVDAQTRDTMPLGGGHGLFLTADFLSQRLLGDNRSVLREVLAPLLFDERFFSLHVRPDGLIAVWFVAQDLLSPVAKNYIRFHFEEVCPHELLN